ncbi:MAG: hypothetical protein ACRC2R_12070 [Xenococcaceae cyanobacterium]
MDRTLNFFVTTTIVAIGLFIVPSQVLSSDKSQLLSESNIEQKNADRAAKNSLKKAWDNFLKGDINYTESKLEFLQSNPNIDFKFSVINKTTFAYPNKFYSEITFVKSDRSIGDKYIIISDGDRVWTYSPELRQYSVNEFEEYKNNKTNLRYMGFSGMFNMSDLDARKEISLNLASDVKQTRIDDSKDRVYERKLKDFLLTMYINPINDTLKFIKMSGKVQKRDFSYSEEILIRNNFTLVSKDKFTFSRSQRKPCRFTAGSL